MEELIDVFLDEFIDKKEISQNERTDMKLTLLEAMPNGLNDETKTRVMSTLKSKMETPSANIFTDKGVNIEAVRTIATETVKNVVETVEKETSAREEAEAKRAAKVDDALSQTIAEADKKEELAQAEKDSKTNNDEGTNYESSVFGNLSLKNMEKAFNRLNDELGNSFSQDEIADIAEMEVATDAYLERIKEIVVNEGVPPEKAKQKVDGEMLEGLDPETAENRREMMQVNLYKKVVRFMAPRIKAGESFYDIVPELKTTFLDENPGITNIDELIKQYHDDLIAVGYSEAFLRGEVDSCKIESQDRLNELVMNCILERMAAGEKFEKASTFAIRFYLNGSIEFTNEETISKIKDDIYQVFLSIGLTKEQLDKGEISQELYDEIKKGNLTLDDAKEKSNEDSSRDTEIEGTKGEYRSNSKRWYGNNNVISARSSSDFNRSKFIADSEASVVGPRYMKALKIFHSEKLKIQSEIDILNNDGNVFTSSYSSKAIYMYNSKKRLIDAINDADKHALKEGNLTSARKHIIAMKKRYIDKAVEVYLTGEKSIYEIVNELGEAGEKYEIIPEEVIMEASRRANKTNPSWSTIIETNERDIAINNLRLEAARRSLNNAIATNNKFAIFMIKRDIARFEKAIEKGNSNCRRVKEKMGVLNPVKSEKLTQDMQEKATISLDYTKNVEQLKEMQFMYGEICKNSQKLDKTFNNAALEYFQTHMTSAEKFGPQLMTALKLAEDPDLSSKIYFREIIEGSIRDFNKVYIDSLKQNIGIYNQEIQDKKTNDVVDNGYTDVLVEKDTLERELQKAQLRDDILSREKVSQRTRTSNKIKELNARRGAALYFENNRSAVEIYEYLKSRGKTVDFTQILKFIAITAKEANIPDKELRAIMTSERAAYKERIEYRGLKDLKENADRQSRHDDAKTLESNIQNLKNSMKNTRESSKSFKATVNERVPDYREKLKVPTLLKSKPFHLHKSEGTKEKKDHSDVRHFKHADNDQVSFKEIRKKRMGIVNITKLVEANGTTSQDIVGEVTDLNKIARAQEERVVDSTEQRDS